MKLIVQFLIAILSSPACTKCPKGYTPSAGGFPGSGSMQKDLQVSRDACADLCSEENHCSSFEYSTSLGLCNLNYEVGIPLQPPFMDYDVCSKGLLLFFFTFGRWVDCCFRKLVRHIRSPAFTQGSPNVRISYK